jgi:hypothetical protein
MTRQQHISRPVVASGRSMRGDPTLGRNASVVSLKWTRPYQGFRERRARRMPTAMKSASGSKQPGIGPGVRDRAR